MSAVVSVGLKMKGWPPVSLRPTRDITNPARGL